MLKGFGDIPFKPGGLASGHEQRQTQAETQAQAEGAHYHGDRVTFYDSEHGSALVFDLRFRLTPRIHIVFLPLLRPAIVGISTWATRVKIIFATHAFSPSPAEDVESSMDIHRVKGQRWCREFGRSSADWYQAENGLDRHLDDRAPS
jgi:hypothetical protein